MSGSQSHSSLNFYKGSATEQYEILDQVGEGSFGSVYKAMERTSGRIVALKMVKVDSIDDTPAIEDVLKEVKFLKKLVHKNICQYFSSFIDAKEQAIFIVLEFLGGFSLGDLLELVEEPFTEKEISFVIRESLEGLRYLHLQKVVHRDIKGGNIMLNEEGSVKLVDFGIASQLTASVSKCDSRIGTPYWMAPEVVMAQKYNSSADIWSIGITAIELGEMAPPMAEIHPMRAMFMIPKKEPPKLKKSTWSTEFVDFLSKCLNKDVKKRFTAEQLLQHKFVKKNKSVKKEILKGKIDKAVIRFAEFIEEMKKEDEMFALKGTSSSVARNVGGGDTFAGFNGGSEDSDDSVVDEKEFDAGTFIRKDGSLDDVTMDTKDSFGFPDTGTFSFAGTSNGTSRFDITIKEFNEIPFDENVDASYEGDDQLGTINVNQDVDYTQPMFLKHLKREEQKDKSSGELVGDASGDSEYSDGGDDDFTTAFYDPKQLEGIKEAAEKSRQKSNMKITDPGYSVTFRGTTVPERSVEGEKCISDLSDFYNSTRNSKKRTSLQVRKTLRKSQSRFLRSLDTDLNIYFELIVPKSTRFRRRYFISGDHITEYDQDQNGVELHLDKSFKAEKDACFRLEDHITISNFKGKDSKDKLNLRYIYYEMLPDGKRRCEWDFKLQRKLEIKEYNSKGALFVRDVFSELSLISLSIPDPEKERGKFLEIWFIFDGTPGNGFVPVVLSKELNGVDAEKIVQTQKVKSKSDEVQQIKNSGEDKTIIIATVPFKDMGVSFKYQYKGFNPQTKQVRDGRKFSISHSANHNFICGCYVCNDGNVFLRSRQF